MNNKTTHDLKSPAQTVSTFAVHECLMTLNTGQGWTNTFVICFDFGFNKTALEVWYLVPAFQASMCFIDNVERPVRKASTTFKIFENKRKFERMLKLSLNSLNFFQHLFDFVLTCFHMFEMGWQTASTTFTRKEESILKQS